MAVPMRRPMTAQSRGPGMAPLDTASASSSTAAGPGLEAAVAGSTCSFTVLVKDENDKQRPVGGDIVVARLIDRVSNRIAAEGHVVDNTDGSYYVSYVPTRCAAELSALKCSPPVPTTPKACCCTPISSPVAPAAVTPAVPSSGTPLAMHFSAAAAAFAASSKPLSMGY